jgi:SNF2 family DNA or RNA helicase
MAKGRVLFGDDMGLGKTIEALATLRAIGDSFPCICVVPKTMKIIWEREIHKWLPDISVWRLQGSKVTETELRMTQPDIFIIHYEQMVKNIDELVQCPWQSVIFDEAHRLKSDKSQRSVAAVRLAYRLALVDSTDYRKLTETQAVPIRMLLTGTPVLNRPEELINLLKVLGRIKDVEPRGVTHFKRRYCGGWDGHGYNGATHLDELHEALRSTCMVRRKKSEVLKELPELQHVIIPVEIDNWKEYQDAERDLIRWVGEEEGRRALRDKKFMESIAHLSWDEQQEAIEARKEDKEERAARAERLVRIGALKQITSRGKMASIKSWVQDFLDSDEKLVVYAFFIDTQKKLIEEFESQKVKVARILGEEADDRKRAANVDMFQNDPACQLLIGSMKAGGEGITLTAASNMAMVEFGWTPAEHDQAEARIHRIGQTADSATIWMFVGVNTIDEWIAALLDEKRAVVNAITDGTEMTKDESILEGLWTKLKEKAGLTQ